MTQSSPLYKVNGVLRTDDEHAAMLKWLRVGAYGVDNSGVYLVKSITKTKNADTIHITIHWIGSKFTSDGTGTYRISAFADDRKATKAEINDAIIAAR